MRTERVHPEAVSGVDVLRNRLRAVGLPLVGCDEHGSIRSRTPRGEDWLSDLLCDARIFQLALKSAAQQWAGETEPHALESLPGLWLAPSALTQRRRRAGYDVAVILTDEVLKSEQLSAMCQSAGMDYQMCAKLIAALPPVGGRDVGRVVSMVHHAIADSHSVVTERESNLSLSQQLGYSFEEINLLYTIIRSMTVVQHPLRFITIVCDELLETLPYGWVGAIFREDEQRLSRLSGRLITSGTTRCPAIEVQSMINNLLQDAEPDVPMVFEFGISPDQGARRVLGDGALSYPISLDGRVMGMLVAGDKQGSNTSASGVHMKLLGATASHMAIFLENAALYDDLNAMFIGTLEALSSAIDAKDPYTCGHSRRVAHLSQQLAHAVGLDEEAVGRVHIAGIVHDVGKIGVPERVLSKAGALTSEEFEWIKKHPEVGHRILKDIPQFSDVLPGVLHHHERWDGRGYPHQLKGDDIPLYARLIALADSFDAMSSDRTYRTAMSRDQVLQEINECAGAQFDPDLAKVFVTLDFSHFDRMVTEHSATIDTHVAAEPFSPPESEGEAA